MLICIPIVLFPSSLTSFESLIFPDDDGEGRAFLFSIIEQNMHKITFSDLSGYKLYEN